MKYGWTLSLATICLGLSIGTATLFAQKQKEKAPPRVKIKEVMGKYFKGKETPITKAIAGKSTPKELMELHEIFRGMGAVKPAKGDEEAWKAKTDALVAAAKALIAKQEGAAGLLEAATNCKACHEAHKGK